MLAEPGTRKKANHDARRARQRAKKGMVLPMKGVNRHGDSRGILDLTPHIASLDMATNGRYTRIGKGYLVRDRR